MFVLKVGSTQQVFTLSVHITKVLANSKIPMALAKSKPSQANRATKGPVKDQKKKTNDGLAVLKKHTSSHQKSRVAVAKRVPQVKAQDKPTKKPVRAQVMPAKKSVRPHVMPSKEQVKTQVKRVNPTSGAKQDLVMPAKKIKQINELIKKIIEEDMEEVKEEIDKFIEKIEDIEEFIEKIEEIEEKFNEKIQQIKKVIEITLSTMYWRSRIMK